MSANHTKLFLFSKSGCPYCSLLKLELTKRRVAFTEIDVSDDTTRQTFYEASGTKTVPQLYASDQEVTHNTLSGTALGGWSEVSSDWNRLENLTGCGLA